ncbi:hypothetical protein CPB85DRAFT_1462550 [Mucidula mucida]|nr:hypothetical protein CPB85DRAFT_1462550 [Mucidula mucida]
MDNMARTFVSSTHEGMRVICRQFNPKDASVGRASHLLALRPWCGVTRAHESQRLGTLNRRVVKGLTESIVKDGRGPEIRVGSFIIPEDLPNGSIVVMNGGEPKIMSREHLFKGIPERKPLVQCCVGCKTMTSREGTGKPFSMCSASARSQFISDTRYFASLMVLGMTGEDKASCLQRQAQNAPLKAKEEICAKEGRRFKQPSRTPGVICNALQLDKGRASPHQINEYAASFVLERDNSAPNDIGKMWLTRIDAAPLYIVKSFLSDASFATATKNNMIFVWLMESDPKLFMSSMVEFHAPPPKESIVIDETWLVQIQLACSGAEMPPDEDAAGQ